jgi:hypothetical protein
MTSLIGWLSDVSVLLTLVGYRARPPAACRSCRTRLIVTIVALIVAAATNAGAELTKGQQKCADAMNKGFQKLASAIGKEAVRCLEAHIEGELGVPIGDCMLADAGGKILKAQDWLLGADAAQCSGDDVPGVGVTAAELAIQTAVAKELDVLAILFGADADGTVLGEEEDRDGAGCQEAVAKTLFKCQATKLKVFRSCVKEALKAGATTSEELEACILPDPKQKIAKACDLTPGADKIRKALDKKCTAKGVLLSVAFPHCDSDDAEVVHACLETPLECSVCLALNTQSHLRRDCDLFDDGQANASCLTPGVTVRATTPHLANDMDPTSVTVIVADADGLPVPGADVVVELASPFFTNQLAHYVQRQRAVEVGDGIYAAALPSPLAGRFLVTATDLATLDSDRTPVVFQAIDLPLAPLDSRPRGAAPDAKDNCGKFFDKLDDEFYPPIVGKKIEDKQKEIDNEADAAKKKQLEDEKKALEQRMKDVGDVMELVLEAIELKTAVEKAKKDSTPLPGPEKEKDLLKKKQGKKQEFQRIADAQKALFQEFFGNPIDFDKVQECTEFFNNFKLVDDFDKAIDRIVNPPDDGKKIVTRGPDASIAHMRWSQFAKCAVDLGIDADLWSTLRVILTKGSKITVAVMSDNDPTKAGKQPKMQDAATITAIRNEFDPLRPAATDTQAQKDAKAAQVQTKFCELIRDIEVENKVVAMLPGEDSNGTLTATLEATECSESDGTNVAQTILSRIQLSREADQLMGLGVDERGTTYVLSGTIQDPVVSLVVAGYGLSPEFGPALSVYAGTASATQIAGIFVGAAAGELEGALDACIWSGTFQLDLEETLDP